jgi:catechol 2,3-dioxygenase-like lactoylglutathione lyase family enzyme
MIDHIGFSVSDFDRAKLFYSSALAPLGYALIAELPADKTESGYAAAGFGAGENENWKGRCTSRSARRIAPPLTPSIVRLSWQAAKPMAPPGLRTHYHPNYYCAFVLDPDGHNIEAVCHAPVKA